MPTLSELRSKLEQMKGKKEEFEKRLDNAEKTLTSLIIQGNRLEEAQSIINTVALQTQQELQFHISSITTTALEAIFPDPYELIVEFQESRGRTEANIFFAKNGERVDPMTGSGGGLIDVAAFSLRCSMWRLQNPSCRPILILDEPFRFLSRDLQPKAAMMMKEISKKLKLQIVMITHNDDLIESADRLFVVTQKNGISKVIQQL